MKGCDQADAAEQAAWATRQPPAVFVFRRECLNPMPAEDATGKPLRLIRNHVKPLRQKYSSSIIPKFVTILHIPPPHEGRIAIVTDVGSGDAVDARRLSACAQTTAFSRTAKSCGPDPPTLGSSLAAMICKAMEAIKPGTAGRARSSR
jgi:hypothetical protein